MCGGICGPGSDGGNYSDGHMDICVGCKRPRWMCNCLSAYSAAAKQTKKKLAPMKKAMIEVADEKRRGGLKKRVNKNRKLTRPLRSKKPVKGF